MRDKPIQFGVRGYPPGTVQGVDEPIPAWGIFRYDDVKHVYANHKIFSSEDRMQEASEAPSMMLVNHDQPEHTFCAMWPVRPFRQTRRSGCGALVGRNL